jgi:hypothetical protein
MERRCSALLSGPFPAGALYTGGGAVSGSGAAGSGASTPRDRGGGGGNGGGGGGGEREEVRISERPVGRDGRVVPEVVGVNQVVVEDVGALISFFNECCENRSVASTRMNDRSSRSHAIYTVVLHRTVVEVSEDSGKVRRGGRRGRARGRQRGRVPRLSRMRVV